MAGHMPRPQEDDRYFRQSVHPRFYATVEQAAGRNLRILQELDFKAVSITGALPRVPKGIVGLKNLRIQMDLHTRKAKDAQADFQDLLVELNALMTRKEPVGIMLHHQRMTPFAFEFLDELLHLLRFSMRSRFLSFDTLLENEHDE